MMNKVVVRIMGGLGNQLFCYAAARRLALVNNAELVIDNVTGFIRDSQYQRRYLLDRFNIPARIAEPAERLEPLERYRRGLIKWWSRRKPFAERRYIEQKGLDFEKRLLSFVVRRTVHIDGLWQSEDYFKDVEPIIRGDLRIEPPKDDLNRRVAEEIGSSIAVALHVRWFDAPNSPQKHNLSSGYYRRAVAVIEEQVEHPRYFLFSDEPEAAIHKLALPKDRLTVVSHNRGDENAWADLWLMSQCRHFITANSTFSWWGAWLGGGSDKIVITPHIVQDRIEATNWGFAGLIPDGWLKL
jgi:hypothetical protein